jgi:nitroreductase
MNTLDVIAARRSIRKFKDIPVPEEMVQTILTAAVQAPSAKNSQPWRFIIVRSNKKAEMVRVFRKGIAAWKARGQDVGSGDWTAAVMEQAPVNIFVFNPNGSRQSVDHFQDVVDIQSIGAAIQNMLLAAHDLGLGTLWICDVFYAYEELSEWLGEPGEMIAAVSLGYADENPGPRPRRPLSEVVRVI